MIFGTLNPEKISHEHITYLSDVATLPWEIQKIVFNNIIHILKIIYITSEKNK